MAGLDYCAVSFAFCRLYIETNQIGQVVDSDKWVGTGSFGPHGDERESEYAG